MVGLVPVADVGGRLHREPEHGERIPLRGGVRDFSYASLAADPRVMQLVPRLSF